MTTLKPLYRICLPLCLLLTSELSYARHAAIVVDANSGNVLQQLDANQAWYPASLTKVMTLYMAFDALKNGRLHMDDMMTVSNHAAQQKPSKLGLKGWERISVQDAILAVITRSANDAAVVLAEHIGGSESQFASKMTQQAHALNMNNSYFMNATGLPHDQQVTTARDLAVLAWRIQRDFPEYYRLFSAPGFYYKGRELHSTNKFVANYPGAEGMKTGYTCGAGFNLIATAQQNGRRLIGVVLGGMSSVERYDLMYGLMDENFYGSGRYNQYSKNHIENMTSYDSGSPPYQLNCGNKPKSTYAYKPHHETDSALAQNTTRISRSYVPKTAPLAQTSRFTYRQDWSVDLGAFSSQMAAETLNKKASNELAQMLSPAHPVVIKRQLYNNETRWHALWSGYPTIYAAGDVCKALWQKDLECTVSRSDSGQTALR